MLKQLEIFNNLVREFQKVSLFASGMVEDIKPGKVGKH